jgi:hypothetical protein
MDGGYLPVMKLRAQAQETLSHVTDASRNVTATTGLASAVLIAVAAVSVLALAVGLIALSKGSE